MVGKYYQMPLIIAVTFVILLFVMFLLWFYAQLTNYSRVLWLFWMIIVPCELLLLISVQISIRYIGWLVNVSVRISNGIMGIGFFALFGTSVESIQYVTRK